MVGFGMLMALLAILGLFFQRKDKILNQKWLLWLIGISLWLPFIANTCGWLITELGRYPWTVYGLFTIADSISPNVSEMQLLFTNIGYFVLFASLGGVMIYLTRREVKKGPYLNVDDQKMTTDPFAKEAF